MHFGFSYVGFTFLVMLLGIAVVILGIGHIGIHMMHRKECRQVSL